MRVPVPRALTLAVVTLAAGTLAACGGSSSGSSSSGTPVRGGTLRIAASGDVTVAHFDPVPSYSTTENQLERGYARQLVTWPASNNFQTTTNLVADAATQVPSKANGGISADGLTYTFHIRPGVMWSTSPARQVTAQDFLRGFKRMGNPQSPVGNPGYYQSTIQGFTAYFNAYQACKCSTAAQDAQFQNSHDISGITAPNSSTLQFKLTQPANDFLEVIAMPFASAAPTEWDNYLPGSTQLANSLTSDGPYVVSSWTPNKQIVMTRNPAWKQSADPVRRQYVNKIVVTEGISNPQTVQQEMQANTTDLSWDQAFPPADIPQMENSRDPNFQVFPGHVSNPYIVFNAAAGPTTNLQVRQAIEYAVDKVAVAKAYGGTAINPPISTAVPPGNIGYQNYNLYPSQGSNGDPNKCKQVLAGTPYAHGLKLVMGYRTTGNHPAIFAAVQQSLAQCGITVTGKSFNGNDMYSFLQTPSNTKGGQWNIAEPGWIPDWYGNNGRSTVQPLFTSPCIPQTVNYGCYDDPTTDSLVNKALTAPTAAAASGYWHQADTQIMKDAAIVPLMNNDTPLYHSSRVKNVIYDPRSIEFDITQLWLNPDKP